MTRRSKPYRIRLSLSHRSHAVPASFYARFIALGWLVVIGAKLAEPRRGVQAWVEDGRLRIEDRKAGVGVSIPSSWRAMDRVWLYRVPNVVKAKYIGEDLNSRQERLIWERNVASMVEAADWQATRDTQGANELVYVEPAHKAEILQALKGATA